MADLKIDEEKMIARLHEEAEHAMRGLSSLADGLRSDVQAASRAAASVSGRSGSDLIATAALAQVVEIDTRDGEQMWGSLESSYGNRWQMGAPQKLQRGRYRALLLILPMGETEGK